MDALDRYTVCPVYPEEFGAKIYKISRDPQGMRLTHMKVTGGSIKSEDAFERRGKSRSDPNLFRGFLSECQ